MIAHCTDGADVVVVCVICSILVFSLDSYFGVIVITSVLCA